MEKIDRRDFMAVSGLSLALAACGASGEANQSDEIQASPDVMRPLIVPGAFQRAFGEFPANYGLDPGKGHPGLGAKLKPDGSQPDPIPENQQPAFNPSVVVVYHVEVICQPLLTSLKAQTAHFAADMSGRNDWDANLAMIARVINYFNGTSSDSSMILKQNLGFHHFKFSKAHHVVIYLANKGLSFLPVPLVFGSTLLDDSPAEKNGSFFDCTLKRNIGIAQTPTESFANEALYMKNFFHRYDDANGVQEISGTSHMQSMNFFTTLRATDDASLLIPVIFDPDTGNMGAGGGYP